MTEYHTIYKRGEGESTQWEDIQRKLGNLPAKEPAHKAAPFAPKEEGARDTKWLDSRDEGELEEAEDEFADDRFLEEYRQKRLEELRKGATRPRYGSVEPIRGSEFVAEVTNAPEGVWVVVHLYKDSVADCAILAQCLAELAPRHPHTKFLRIVSTDCIPGYPDANLPTVLLYRDTKCVSTLVGLRQFGGQAASPEGLAATLNRHAPGACGDEDDTAAAAAAVSGLVGRLLDAREQAADDEDSDFE